MKKIALTILLCGIFVIGLTGCGKTENESNIGEISNIKVATDKDVSLAIEDETVKNTGVTLVLVNNSNKLLYYNDVYEIEVQKDNVWHKINAELNFNEPLWGVEQNNSGKIEVNWQNGYGELAKGKYRIIKEVYFENELDQKFYVAAEFKVK